MVDARSCGRSLTVAALFPSNVNAPRLEPRTPRPTMPAMIFFRWIPGLVLLLGLTACSTSVVPMRPLVSVQYEEPAVTQPATTSAPATASAATKPATVTKTRVTDPNQTVRHAYRTNYDYLWGKALQTLVALGYTIDRQDYRLGVIVTKPKYGAHFVEAWRPDQTSWNAALENSMHSQRRSIRLTISRAPNPAFFEVAAQVIVERSSNPSEEVGGAVGALGHTPALQRSDYVEPVAAPARWRVLGHDPQSERKVLDRLFKGL